MNFIILITTAFFLGACQQQGVEVYRVPKEQAQMPSMPSMPHNHPPTDQSMDSGGVTWVLPAGWTPKPAGGMRVGSFAAAGKDGSPVDISVIPLSGQAGGELSNINRWRDQIALPALKESEMAAHTRTVKANGHTFTVVHFINQGKGVRGALATVNERTWFFKMSGPEQAVADNGPAFDAFLKTVKIP